MYTSREECMYLYINFLEFLKVYIAIHIFAHTSKKSVFEYAVF
jgi:hypothetical protein